MATNDFMCYLKTTDTCNLHCNHCFTNGTNGKKGWFDVEATIDFFKRLHEYHPDYDNGNISFHGGEPMLAPTRKLFEVWNAVKDFWPNVWWSVQTNLTYPLTPDKIEVFEKICGKSYGTSWDKNIRWPKPKQEQLWRDNVKQLTDMGHDITVMVCLSGDVVNHMEPIDIIRDMASLGIKHINFERITPNGNALKFIEQGIMPSNKALDLWFLKMWEQTTEHKTWEFIDNMFFDSILSSLIYNTHAGCRCRECEQKILTINADGTIGGCPNSAVDNTFGTIHDDVEALMNSEGRMCNIAAEIIRHPACSICPVFEVCNGDCHQLAWQGNVCAAPKSMMTKMKKDNDIALYKTILNGFMGQE